jgi:ligand-binding SRPBCC domain-containing protein
LGGPVAGGRRPQPRPGPACREVRVHALERAQQLPRPPEEVFELFADASTLEEITPPWLSFRLVTAEPIEMGVGTLIEYRLRLHGMPIRWLARIDVWEPGRRFVDVQVIGPYRLWRHTHTFERAGRGTLVRDVVRYSLPRGPLGALAHFAFVRRDLGRIFDYRQEAVARLVAGAGRDEPEAVPS